MIISLKIETVSCKSCPLRRHNVGHGECFDYCGHPDAPAGYGSVIDDRAGLFPKWCPGLIAGEVNGEAGNVPLKGAGNE